MSVYSWYQWHNIFKKTCKLSLIKDSPTILYEDNAAILPKLKEDILKAIKWKIYHQKFSIFMSLKKWKNRCPTNSFK